MSSWGNPGGKEDAGANWSRDHGFWRMSPSRRSLVDAHWHSAILAADTA